MSKNGTKTLTFTLQVTRKIQKKETMPEEQKKSRTILKLTLLRENIMKEEVIPVKRKKSKTILKLTLLKDLNFGKKFH